MSGAGPWARGALRVARRLFPSPGRSWTQRREPGAAAAELGSGGCTSRWVPLGSLRGCGGPLPPRQALRAQLLGPWLPGAGWAYPRDEGEMERLK